MLRQRAMVTLVFVVASSLYCTLSWVVSGGETWWVIDFVDGVSVFSGDDAYRFFLARTGFRDPSVLGYSFMLPVNLLLEHAVIRLASGELLFARLAHSLLLGAGSLCLVWYSCVTLGFGRAVATTAVLVMGLLPLYAFVSLSFYGEAWLGFSLCLAMLLFLRRHFYAVAVVAGLFPLIRPEGIFFLLALLLFFVRHKRWRETLILLLPGTTYFLVLLAVLPDIESYSYWRAEQRRLLNKVLVSEDYSSLLLTYPPALIMPALLGIFSKPIQRLWPFLLGGGCWLAMLQVFLFTGGADFEPRYVYAVIPILAVMWAGGLSLVRERIRSSGARAMVLSSALAWALLGYPAKVSLVEGAVRKNGWTWVAEKMIDGEWERIFPSYLPGYMAGYKEMAERISAMLEYDSSIDRVIAFDSFLYYFLDPDSLPRRARVEYPALRYPLFHTILGGQIFTQHPGERMFSYIRFREPLGSLVERRALYVDKMPMPRYPYRWEFGPGELYLFAYTASDQPDVDLDTAPEVDLRREGRVM